jgi:hypothetical protein
MELIVGSMAIVLVLLVLAAVRVSRLASWRSVAQVAMATGSLRACVEFIRYCEKLQ